jgi:hypothetical protein
VATIDLGQQLTAEIAQGADIVDACKKTPGCK